LAPDGKRFVEAAPADRKALWREQLLKLHLFREITDVLRREPNHEVDRDFVIETIILHLPQENYQRIFDTFLRWARYGDLIHYDAVSGVVVLSPGGTTH